MILCPSHPDLLYGCTGPFRLRSSHELTVLRVCVLSDILDVSVHAFVLCLTVCACAYMCVCLSANTSLTLPLSHLCVPPPPSNIWDHRMGSGDETPDETDTEVWHKLMLLHLCLKTRHIFNTVFEGRHAKLNKAHIHTGYYQVSGEKSSQILISKLKLSILLVIIQRLPNMQQTSKLF